MRPSAWLSFSRPASSSLVSIQRCFASYPAAATLACSSTIMLTRSLFIIIGLFAACDPSAGFAPHSSSRCVSSTCGRATAIASQLVMPMAGSVSESEMQVQGNDIIRKAAIEAGAQPDNIDIDWKGDQIIVTISGELVKLGGPSLEGLDDEELAEELDMYFDADELDQSAADEAGIFGDVDIGDYVEDELEGEDDEDEDEPSITGIARAINRALAELGEGSVGDIIAQTHSIEVTTPGASDVLQGDVMFEAYKGFEVLVETTETNKKGKKKVKEGLLVEKNDEHTVINQKGRISKIKNEKVECVRLPKGKKEKGAK